MEVKTSLKRKTLSYGSPKLNYLVHDLLLTFSSRVQFGKQTYFVKKKFHLLEPSDLCLNHHLEQVQFLVNQREQSDLNVLNM